MVECSIKVHEHIIIGSKRLLLEILYGAKTVFTRLARTPPKVNRFECNLEQCEPNVGDGPGRFCARSAQ